MIVASDQLARGTPSVAIGVDMHLTAPLNVVRRWRMTVAGGQERRAAAFAASNREVAHDGSCWRRHQRARPGPDAPGDDRRAHACARVASDFISAQSPMPAPPWARLLHGPTAPLHLRRRHDG